MSADNFIAIQRRGRKWHVWMGDMSGYIENDRPIPGGWMHRVFDERQDAWDYAHAMYREESIVEYGIIRVNDIGMLGDLWQRVAALRYYLGGRWWITRKRV